MHLVRRFFKSLWARAPSEEEESWVAGVLEPGELALWRRLPRFDRRHTIEVARRTERFLEGTPEADDRWLAAALLHDIGKLDTGFGVVGRVVATLARVVCGRDRVVRWASRDGFRGRVGRYVDHGAIGAAMIRTAGGRERVARWAEIHHAVEHSEPIDPGGIVPKRAVRALRAADRD